MAPLGDVSDHLHLVRRMARATGTDLTAAMHDGDLSAEDNADTFRLDSIRSKMDQPGRMSLFVEHKNLWGLTGRAELFRPFDNIEKEARTRFSPNRTGLATEFERTRLVEKPVLILQLSGVF